MTAGMTSVQIQARARLELSRRSSPHQRGGVQWKDRLPEFLEATKIEVVNGQETRLAPFQLWEPDPWVGDDEARYRISQRYILEQMLAERLIDFLKARQLGVTWCVCGFALHQCVTVPGYPVLALSRGLFEANELIRRIGILYHNHEDRRNLPKLITDNTGELEWEGGSRILSLAATKDAGRSFTAALVILDEWAFMQWPHATLASVKPTIDAGGKLVIISSADGMGTARHQQWNAAKAETNGYKAIFLPWYARPGRGPEWRSQKIAESGGDEATVKREYPTNDIEAFANAAGLVYPVWSDGPEDGNVVGRADFIPGGGDVLLSADDGYAGRIDPTTGQYTPMSHPRVFGLYQERHDGTLCRFDESYAVETLPERQIAEVLALPFDLDQVIDTNADAATWIERVHAARAAHPDWEWYPLPDYAMVDSSAAELRGRLTEAGIGNFGGTHPVEEGIKVMRRFLAKDMNGRRRLLVHPRCVHFRAEMASYRQDDKGKPIKQFDHGPDECRMMCWKLRDE